MNTFYRLIAVCFVFVLDFGSKELYMNYNPKIMKPNGGIELPEMF